MKDDIESPNRESYYFILEFLEKESEKGAIPQDKLTDFKKTIRDNKYVSTYIKALKEKMDELKSLDDLANLQIRDRDSKTMMHELPFDIQNIFNAYTYSEIETDPVKVTIKIIENALKREGKICDFRDSVNPNKKIGICENENHDELWREKNYMQDEWDKWNEISKTKDPEDEMPVPQEQEELELTLYTDDDTSKFNDEHTSYVCKICMEYIQEHGECEVSCDMG